MENDAVLFKKENHVGVITTNRPEVCNSLNAAVFRQLDTILNRVLGDDEVRVLVLAGRGDSFGVSVDINELPDFNAQSWWSASRFSQSVFNKLERLGRPSIAAIDGAALGNGLELALSCTFRVASERAKLGFPDTGLGIIPTFVGTQRVIRCVGRARAAELLLFRRVFDSVEAFRIGLVNAIAEQGQVVNRAMDMARELSNLSSVATRIELQLLQESENMELETGFAFESALGALAASPQEAEKLLTKLSDTAPHPPD